MKLKSGKERGKRMTLNQLKVGNSAVITTVGGDGALRCRLLDMGLIPHTRVTLQKVAPMGDPIEIRVRGYELTLRVEEAQKSKWRTSRNDLRTRWKSELRKTTLFNALTGSNQHVGNFPGVTVDQKMGEIIDEKGCSVVDLPGIYSLRPYTQEEIVSRDFILNQKPDGIINIVDATNIERNLYLTLQLLELRIPMVLALNMMDEVRSNGGSIDVQKMSASLGIPVVPIAAAKGEGVSELVNQAIAVARSRTLPKVTDFCADDSAVHRCIHAVTHLIADHADRIGVLSSLLRSKADRRRR